MICMRFVHVFIWSQHSAMRPFLVSSRCALWVAVFIYIYAYIDRLALFFFCIFEFFEWEGVRSSRRVIASISKTEVKAEWYDTIFNVPKAWKKKNEFRNSFFWWRELCAYFSYYAIFYYTGAVVIMCFGRRKVNCAVWKSGILVVQNWAVFLIWDDGVLSWRRVYESNGSIVRPSTTWSVVRKQ